MNAGLSRIAHRYVTSVDVFASGNCSETDDPCVQKTHTGLSRTTDRSRLTAVRERGKPAQSEKTRVEVHTPAGLRRGVIRSKAGTQRAGFVTGRLYCPTHHRRPRDPSAAHHRTHRRTEIAAPATRSQPARAVRAPSPNVVQTWPLPERILNDLAALNPSRGELRLIALRSRRLKNGIAQRAAFIWACFQEGCVNQTESVAVFAEIPPTARLGMRLAEHFGPWLLSTGRLF